MKTIKAIFNVGRWIWICENCGAGNLIKPGDEMGFCGDEHCYPDKFATKEAVLNDVIIRGYDKKKQDQAKRKAWADNKVYKIRFPKNHKEIVETLRVRKAEHASWEVGETIEDLLKENDTHPKLTYLKKPEYIKEVNKKEKIAELPIPELPILSDKVSRRIK